jgi:hypothetical protein
MTIWRKLEFRGRDVNGNPFVDFGFVEVAGGQLILTSHLLREPLRVGGEEHVVPAFKHFYAEQGFSNLRYKVLWESGGPVDTPFHEGWLDS